MKPRIIAVFVVLHLAIPCFAQAGLDLCWGLSTQDQARRQAVVAKDFDYWKKQAGGQFISQGAVAVLSLDGGAYRWAGLKTNRAFYTNPRIFMFPKKHDGGTLSFTAYPMGTSIVGVDRFLKIGGQIWSLPGGDTKVDYSRDGSKSVYGLGVRVEVWVADGVTDLDIEARLSTQTGGARCNTSDRVPFSITSIAFAEGTRPTATPPSAMVTVPRTGAPGGSDQACLDMLQELEDEITRTLSAGKATREEMSGWIDKIREIKGCLKK